MIVNYPSIVMEDFHIEKLTEEQKSELYKLLDDNADMLAGILERKFGILY